MPSIRITDDLGLNLEIPVQSPLTKYLRNDLVNLAALPSLKNELQRKLGETTLKPAGVGLDFKHKVELGPGDAELAVEAGVSGRIAIHKAGAELFGNDLIGNDLSGDALIGDAVTVPPGQAYVSASILARLGPGITREIGDITFGFKANSEVQLENHQRFAADDTVEQAFTASIAQFALPGDLDDLRTLPARAICCASGSGSLTLSAEVDVAIVPNPLAIPGLPAAVPGIALKPGASIGVSASFMIGGAYQLRVRKLDDRVVRLGYYKRDETEFALGVEARAGVKAGVGQQDWISPLLRAVSRDPQADSDELQRAGLRLEHIEEIQAGIKSGVERSLAASLQAQLSTVQSGEAAFLYDIDLNVLANQGHRAVNAALDGDISLLAEVDDAGSLHGITVRRSVFKETRERGLSLRINLLGILNFVTISRLLVNGAVVTDALTGEVTITDKATAIRLQALMVNFGENQAKIRRLFFEAMVATVAYRASGIIESVDVTSAHTYFELHHKTTKQAMKDNLEALGAVGLIDAAGKQARLGVAERFGRSALLIEAVYDDRACERLFFDENGNPREPEHYEQAGRQALAALVAEDDPDAKRRIPAVDDALWADLKNRGSRDAILQRLRERLGDDTPLPLLSAIDSDFAFIAAFWSKALHKTAKKLAEVRKFLANNRGAGPDDNRFQKLRKELAKHLAQVASDTKERFGDPLGLVALYYATGRSAAVAAKLSCPLFSLALPETGVAPPRTLTRSAGAE